MKSDQSKQTKPSSKDSEIEEVLGQIRCIQGHCFHSNDCWYNRNYHKAHSEVKDEDEANVLLSVLQDKALLSLFDQYTQSKLKAFAGDFEALLKNQPMPKRGDVVPDIYVEVLHRIEGANATRGEIRQALKAIKEKYQL